jgi:hypothetical protein
MGNAQGRYEMIVTAITAVELSILSEGEFTPGTPRTRDDPGFGPEVETHEISSLFVSVDGKQVDILAGVDRKSPAWRLIEKNIFDALGEHIAEDLAIEGEAWE